MGASGKACQLSPASPGREGSPHKGSSTECRVRRRLLVGVCYLWHLAGFLTQHAGSFQRIDAANLHLIPHAKPWKHTTRRRHLVSVRSTLHARRARLTAKATAKMPVLWSFGGWKHGIWRNCPLVAWAQNAAIRQRTPKHSL